MKVENIISKLLQLAIWFNSIKMNDKAQGLIGPCSNPNRLDFCIIRLLNNDYWSRKIINERISNTMNIDWFRGKLNS